LLERDGGEIAGEVAEVEVVVTVTTKALYERIETIAAELVAAPYIGRPGRIPGTRELIIMNTPYILPYQIRSNCIEILRVYHGARRWAKRFD
jgi:plasmid stabilization system protein ParE